MRTLIFSDIHSNLDALEAVLADAGKRGFDTIVCLGDFVGYGANPNECVHTIAQRSDFAAVLGNHDAAVISPSERDFFNPVAQAGIVYSENNIDTAAVDFLKQLPMVIDSRDEFLAVHASPFKPETWVYVLDLHDAADAFQVMRHPVAFVGHTHYPVIFKMSGSAAAFSPGEKVVFDSGETYIVNVGSVGQPRDGDPRAAYVIHDDEENSAEIFRTEYDIDKASTKIIQAGLPPMLAERIRKGH